MNLRTYVFFTVFFLLSSKAFSAPISSKVTADRFHQVFTTAAYSTALGGAIGTAALVFTPNPAENLRFIAFGASIGFLSGIILGGYLAFVPSYSSGGAQGAAAGLEVNPVFYETPTIETTFGKSGQVQQVAFHLPSWKL